MPGSPTMNVDAIWAGQLFNHFEDTRFATLTDREHRSVT